MDEACQRMLNKMTNFNYDLFKVSKMCVLFLWLKIAINFQKWVYIKND